MQTEELEDLEFDFEEGYGQKIEYLENAMIEATRNSDYDTFMEMWNGMKDLCQNAGDGGKYYFSQFYENDPRIKKLKQIKDGPVYHTVLEMLHDQGPSESKNIYGLVENANYETLRSLVRKKVIKRIPDSSIYYIDGQDISESVEEIRRRQESARRIAEECAGNIPELTIPSEEKVKDMIHHTLVVLQDQAEAERETEKNPEKRRKGIFSFFWET